MYEIISKIIPDRRTVSIFQKPIFVRDLLSSDGLLSCFLYLVLRRTSTPPHRK